MAKAKKTTLKKPRADKDDEKDNFADKAIKKNKGDKKKPAPNDLENDQELDERELGGEG